MSVTMSPRKYLIGKRAALLARTRDRIVSSAMSLYERQGIQATSMRDVARLADVAPATVLNHFATPEQLTEAVLARITETLKVPSSKIFRGAHTPAERLQRLVPAMFEFYDRSERWFDMYQRERFAVPAIQTAERRFWESVHELYAEALGPLLMDEEVGPATFGLTNPGTLGSLRMAGLSLEQAGALMTDLLMYLVERRSRPSGDRAKSAKKASDVKNRRRP
jgi:AcrR family transcriptional regulator